jgi:hypothetical protein
MNVREVVLGRREVQPEGLLRGFQLVRSKEFVDDRKPALADLIDGCVRHPHGSALYARQRSTRPAGGICGSDPHLVAHNTGPSPTLMGMGGLFPFVLGHEISGRVIEAGPECRHAVGTRVAVEPCIPCAARGIDPSCANCARGWTSSCLDLDSRVVTGGRSLGFTQGLGGERGEQVLAHVSMLHPVPDAVSDRGASLHEPVSIACHGILRTPPRDGEPVRVVSAGIIGLAALALPESWQWREARHQRRIVCGLGAETRFDRPTGARTAPTSSPQCVASENWPHLHEPGGEDDLGDAGERA